MPVKYASLPWAEAAPIHPTGLDAVVFKDGRILVNEWVSEEVPGRVQVHSDDGTDYIRRGDPTMGMLYDNVDIFVELEEDELLDRWASILQGEVLYAVANLKRPKVESSA